MNKNDPISYPALEDLKNPTDAIKQCACLYCFIWQEPPWCEDFWEEAKVIQMLSQEMQRPDARCFLALLCEEVIGFSWGYSVNRQELSAIAGHNQLDFVFETANRVFYIDELAVDQTKRLRHIGRNLTTKLLGQAKARGLTQVVLRTDIKAIAARILYARLGFCELSIQDSQHPDRTYWLLRF